MTETVQDWLQRNSDRVLASQRSQIDTAKLLVSFTLAVAATLVATALQVSPIRPWDYAGVISLGLTFLASILTVGFDRWKEPNRHLAQDRATANSWPGKKLLEELRNLALEAEDENYRVVAIVRVCATVQVVLATVSSAFSVISLLLP